MVIDMHRAGINTRFMGHVRKHTTNALLNRWLLMGTSTTRTPPFAAVKL
jgi:hypothetical protein